MSEQTIEYGVRVPLETALLIRRAFLPTNPRKMRKADPRVVEAAIRFISETAAAQAREAMSKTESLR